jgi:hypothetical protein
MRLTGRLTPPQRVAIGIRASRPASSKRLSTLRHPLVARRGRQAR